MIPLRFSFYLSTFLGVFLVDAYYMNAAYPFESVDISYYSQGLIYKLTSYSFNPKITLYMTGIIFGYFYHILSKKIPTPRFLKGIIVALIIFMLYILILFFSFDLNRLNYIQLYLVQDLIAFLIFYLAIAIIYRRY
tara:strand:+ start:447 stop:854 length:408 start_codon:yes stop_codon:yes gene_type:complete